jgi:hypothetical protein
LDTPDVTMKVALPCPSVTALLDETVNPEQQARVALSVKPTTGLPATVTFAVTLRGSLNVE